MQGVAHDLVFEYWGELELTLVELAVVGILELDNPMLYQDILSKKCYENKNTEG